MPCQFFGGRGRSLFAFLSQNFENSLFILVVHPLQNFRTVYMSERLAFSRIWYCILTLSYMQLSLAHMPQPSSSFKTQLRRHLFYKALSNISRELVTPSSVLLVISFILAPITVFRQSYNLNFHWWMIGWQISGSKR